MFYFFYLVIIQLFTYHVSSASLIPADGVVNGNYIGGFYRADIHQKTLFSSSHRNVSKVVRDENELLKALKDGEKNLHIFLDSRFSYDLSKFEPISLPEGLLLSSDRGLRGSLGALVFSNSLNTNPMFFTAGDNVQISGVRLRGPDGEIVNFNELNKQHQSSSSEKLPSNRETYGIPNSSMIHVRHRKFEIENCEIFNWSHSGIFVRNGAEALIHHNYIHHNQRKGLGYGIMIDNGRAIIQANIFDYNRHAIAGTGKVNTFYDANNNIALENSMLQGHIFDMHGGKDRKDGSDIAGKQFHIRDNLFFVTSNSPVVLIRGKPDVSSEISSNKVVVKYGFPILSESIYFKQINSKGNLKVFNNVLIR